MTQGATLKEIMSLSGATVEVDKRWVRITPYICIIICNIFICIHTCMQYGRS